ncbi:polysaccharide deacetylase family protein [Actinoplanes sp. CA-030573]|uniref:polysaccharide deacetylase family protein n=1 Tax=Actinoplanes sp. CA-030573 TaxID=3239898 RepID=UPI003D8BEB4C
MRRFPSRALVALVTVAGTVTASTPPAQAAGSRPGGPPTPVVVDTARGHGNVVSFTFDDGPNPPDTLNLLAVLRKHHVKAVFCLWGDHVREHPEVVRAIARDGHTLCNHSLHHDDMSAWTPEQIRADLEATSALIHQAVPHAKIAYFRARTGPGARPRRSPPSSACSRWAGASTSGTGCRPAPTCWCSGSSTGSRRAP